MAIAAVAIVWGQQWMELRRLRAEHRLLLNEKITRLQVLLPSHNGAIERQKQMSGGSTELTQDMLEMHKKAEGELAKLKKSLSDLDR
jgi:hypothetical protein